MFTEHKMVKCRTRNTVRKLTKRTTNNLKFLPFEISDIKYIL